MWRALTRNWKLKLISLGLAFAMWFYVFMEENKGIERSVIVQPEVTNIPSNLIMTENIEKGVTVILSGAARVVEGISAADIKVYIDAKNGRPGENLYRVNVDQKAIPNGVNVRVEPPQYKIRLEERVIQDIAVKATIVGEPRRGYAVNSVKVSPSTVKVSGVKGRIERLREIGTEDVDVNGADQTIRRFVKLITPPDARILDTQFVTVVVEVEEEFVEREMIVPVRLMGLSGSSRATVKPTSAELVVRGPRSAVEGLGREDITADVDIGGLERGRYSLVGSPSKPPPRIEIVSLKPTIFDVTISGR
ncbi:MAG: CdaR family protein [bacterium]